MTLFVGTTVLTGMDTIFSTVGATIGAQMMANAPSLSALTAAMIASSTEKLP